MAMTELSLGIIETQGLVSAVEAADVAAKAAAVVVTSAELSQNGYATIAILGELSSVQAAVEAATSAVERVGRLVACKVIPRPDDNIWKIVGRRRFVAAYEDIDSGPALQWSDFRTDSATESILPRREIPASAGERKKVIAKNDRQAARKGAPSRKRREIIAAAPPQTPPISLEELEKLAVVKLRRYARTLSDLPLKGRQISMANKSQLLEAISSKMKQ